MQLTSTQCRTQEAIQWERAKSEPLENVRMVARRAAITWGQEAVFLEGREAGKHRNRTISEILEVQRQRTDNDDGKIFSENPDLGFADA